MDNVTGRDGYIITKALAYAIEAISSLPAAWQENGDQNDMKRLLESLVPNDTQLQHLLRGVRAHLDGTA